MNKKWYTSKTVWFNILTIGGAVFSGVAAMLPTLEIVITPENMSIALFIVGTFNVVLRAITTGPINWKEGNETRAD